MQVNWAFDFAFLVAEFRTTTPESVNSSSIAVCRGLWRPNYDISKAYSYTFGLDKNLLNKIFYTVKSGKFVTLVPSTTGLMH